MKLLFCSANPYRNLDLVAELEGVLHGINAKNWEVIYLHDVTLQSLSDALRRHQPEVVHFCGHSSVDELILINPTTSGASSIAPFIRHAPAVGSSTHRGRLGATRSPGLSIALPLGGPR